jgi:signal transduction histidine kinase
MSPKAGTASKRISIGLITVGLLVLVFQSIYHAQRTRELYELQLKSQRQSIEQALTQKWIDHLLTLMRTEILPKTYKLEWDYTGTHLESDFFPREDVKLQWDDYRTFKQESNADKIKSFLIDSLRYERSWDRVLAIEEWRRLYTEPLPINLSPYEQTLVSSEARKAYNLIFAKIHEMDGVAHLRRVTSFRGVFMQINEAGRVEAFVPSIESVESLALPSFLKAHQIDSLQIGATPWEIKLDGFESSKDQMGWIDLSVLFMATIFVFVGIILFLLDISEHRKRLLKQVSFLNQIVHEIKTPLAGLKLHVQLLRGSNPSRENIESIEESVNRMNGLFDDIILMNRPHEPARLVPILPEELNARIKEWVEEFKPSIQTEGSVQTMIPTDETRLRIILRNLLSNATKYGQSGVLRIKETTDTLVLEIEDAGPGVSMADSQKIFSEFFRTETAKLTRVDGLGIGLSIVKKLCQEINATIGLVNPGQPHALFRVSIPRRTA